MSFSFNREGPVSLAACSTANDRTCVCEISGISEISEIRISLGGQRQLMHVKSSYAARPDAISKIRMAQR